MRSLNLSVLQLEFTLGILGEVDLSPLLAALGGKGRLAAFAAGLAGMKEVREHSILARLEAVWSASPDELDNAALSEDLLKSLVRKAGSKPATETLEGLQAFFASLGLSLDASDDSSNLLEVVRTLERLTETMQTTDPKVEAGSSPSSD